ncbi:MAG: lysoplasmalogenase [Treponema sp.]|nr:lysoplasmalogenase [Treponema sp.]
MLRIFIALFIGMSAAHLISLILLKRKLRIVTKICLMPLLLAVYISGADTIFIPIMIALIFGWWGDMFLLNISERRFFKLGLASFLLGHLCYISSFLYTAGTLNVMALLVSIAAAVPFGVAALLFTRPEKSMRLPALVYEIIIILMSLSALQLLLARRDGWSLLVFAGSVCFLISDTLLAHFTFRTRLKRGDFFVMLFYIAAQSGIVWGMMRA